MLGIIVLILDLCSYFLKCPISYTMRISASFKLHTKPFQDASLALHATALCQLLILSQSESLIRRCCPKRLMELMFAGCVHPSLKSHRFPSRSLYCPLQVYSCSEAFTFKPAPRGHQYCEFFAAKRVVYGSHEDAKTASDEVRLVEPQSHSKNPI